MIQPGTVAFIKTTDEPVFVLRVDEVGPGEPEFGQLSLQTVYVRRPVAESDKISHHLERYAVEELETREENRDRKIEWEVSTRKAISTSVKADGIGAALPTDSDPYLN